MGYSILSSLIDAAFRCLFTFAAVFLLLVQDNSRSQGQYSNRAAVAEHTSNSTSEGDGDNLLSTFGQPPPPYSISEIKQDSNNQPPEYSEQPVD